MSSPLAALPKLRWRRDPKPGVPRALPLGPGVPVPDALREAARAAAFTGAAGQSAAVQAPADGGGPVWLLGTGAAPAAAGWEAAGGGAEALRAGLGSGAPGRFALDARRLPPAVAASLAAGAVLRAWRPDATRRPDPDAAPPLHRLDVLTEDPSLALQAFEAMAPGLRGAIFARQQVFEPANRLTPKIFAERLEALDRTGLAVEVWGRKRLTEAGFGALLAVGQGSAAPPRLAVLRWAGDSDAAPVALVGKGICFDTGGISIKPAAGMEEMRADMAGAAACAGAMLALALRGSPVPAVAVLPLAENMTGGGAYRPGDVVRTLSGRTVEVIDTDAEGRMVLADALHHACTAFRPRAVLDLATLTGSIVTALGYHRAGVFGNDGALMAAAAAAGEAVGEPLWPMPIGARHRSDLDSDIADLKQCLPSGGGGGWAGRFTPDASHAAAFLREFVGDTPWAHLDIAGVESWSEDRPTAAAGPSGFGARLLDRLLADRFAERRRRRG
ncbi:leucyl aminopeptidase family protein [Roseomonas sp. BN140053]|uniref:leucyl aminopeptidase family protein n=1 Tax=Roseomonas sp. BN140053 TaxID=3391898 RepID=UPI0039E9757D